MTEQAKPWPETVYITFCCEIHQPQAEALVRACVLAAGNGTKAIHLLMASPGGDVGPGLMAHGMLCTLHERCKIITYNVSAVDSIAIPIFMAGQERYASPHSTFLFHRVTQQIPFPIDAKVGRTVATAVELSETVIAGMLAARAFRGDSAIPKALFKKGKPVLADRAKELGIIDDIRTVTVPPDATLWFVPPQ